MATDEQGEKKEFSEFQENTVSGRTFSIITINIIQKCVQYSYLPKSHPQNQDSYVHSAPGPSTERNTNDAEMMDHLGEV